ncbi:hypothetical protein FRX31_003503 [Thalictrum thalictroides]|uniref:Uncharacterized protein n=1 Tax=Thalictrum thalictroides TaxID=46969 RepID=A0A7J6XES6_THATH|nr:hypothetical protein FRX31_003503 [Thalictrum thalictroides]
MSTKGSEQTNFSNTTVWANLIDNEIGLHVEQGNCEIGASQLKDVPAINNEASVILPTQSDGFNDRKEEAGPCIQFGSFPTQSDVKVSSWADKLGNTSGSRDKLEPAIINRQAIVHVEFNQFQDFNAKYANMMIGNFVGRRLGYMFV